MLLASEDIKQKQNERTNEFQIHSVTLKKNFFKCGQFWFAQISSDLRAKPRTGC